MQKILATIAGNVITLAMVTVFLLFVVCCACSVWADPEPLREVLKELAVL